MQLQRLREQVCAANRDLVRSRLVTLSFGNASGVDRAAGVFVIKPSGVDYDRLAPDDLVVCSIDDGRVVEGTLRPSSDTPTHLRLYQAFPAIGGVVHTHSTVATAWAQATRPIPALGTTHADHFAGSVPVTRALTPAEIGGEYEAATGDVIVETVRDGGYDPMHLPAVLVRSHGPFTWGRDAADAVINAVALETVATMALHAVTLAADLSPMDPTLLAKHHGRKHGPGASYGQR